MLIVFLRAVLLYVLVIFSIRLMGKRQIGELQPSEFVVTILISNIATLPIEDINLPMVTGIIPILTIVSLDVIVSTFAVHSRRLREIISGTPRIIIREGKIDQKMMRELRYTVDDLMESLRGQGIFDVTQVQFAIVETTGKISVYQKNAFAPVTPDILKIKPKESDPPQIVVNDGEVINSALSLVGLTRKGLERILRKENTDSSQVFLMTTDGKGNNVIIKKEIKKQ